MASFCEAFLGKRFVCCTLTIVYSIYKMVGRSIASIYDLGGIFTLGRIYDIGYGPPTVQYKHIESPRNAKVHMVVQSPYYMYILHNMYTVCSKEAIPFICGVYYLYRQVCMEKYIKLSNLSACSCRLVCCLYFPY